MSGIVVGWRVSLCAAALVAAAFGSRAGAQPLEESQQAQIDAIERRLPAAQVKRLRVGCVEGTLPTPDAGMPSRGQQCVAVLVRTARDGDQLGYYDWLLTRLLKQEGIEGRSTSETQAANLLRAVNGYAGKDQPTLPVDLNNDGTRNLVPITAARAFDAAFMDAFMDASASGPSALSALASDKMLWRTTEACFMEGAQVSLANCRAAAREHALRAARRRSG